MLQKLIDRFIPSRTKKQHFHMLPPQEVEKTVQVAVVIMGLESGDQKRTLQFDVNEFGKEPVEAATTIGRVLKAIGDQGYHFNVNIALDPNVRHRLEW